MTPTEIKNLQDSDVVTLSGMALKDLFETACALNADSDRIQRQIGARIFQITSSCHLVSKSHVVELVV